MWEFGVEVGDCMELKDSVGCFFDNFEVKILELNSFVLYVFD